MTKPVKSKKELLLELEKLKTRLAEAEDTLRAIQQGEVDAIIRPSSDGDRIYTLQGAEQPYRVFFEAMNEGAVTMTLDGTILYCNRRFADLVKMPLERVTGMSFLEYFSEDSQPAVASLLSETGQEGNAIGTSLKVPGEDVVPVNISVNPLKTEDREAVCAIVTDLSDLMLMRSLEKAIEELAAMNEELRASQEEQQTSERTLRDSRKAALNLMEEAVIARKAAEKAEEEIKQQVEKLGVANEEAERLTRVTVGRELRMVELKKEVNELCNRAGVPPRYNLDFVKEQ